MGNPVEVWKAEKHGLDVWPDVQRYAAAGTPMSEIEASDLERMKWHGFFYRKRDAPGRYMNRIRITAGEMTAEQAREIAHIAYEYGHGIVDVTTRANVQVQGLEIEHLPKVAERLERVGLTAKQTGHDNIRNVFAHPFSGLLPDELIDTRALCHDTTALFLDSREYSDLPRKLNVCLNGTDNHSAHFWTQDISYLAVRQEHGEVAFQVLIGGTQGQNPHLAWHLPVLVRPEQVVAVTRAIFDLFRARGTREKRNAARFRFLVEELGVGGVLEWLEEHLPFRLQPGVREPVPAASQDELVGWFPQRDSDRWIMGLCVPLGRMSWRQLEGLAVLSRKWGDGQLRTTHEQGIAVINIPRGFRGAAATDAAALGLSLHADPLALNTMACTGSQFCNIAVTETKGHMFRLIEALRRKALMLHGIRIHMSGCPSSCAQHFTADIGLKGVRVRRLLGTREGFDVFLGGGIAGQVHMGLPYKLGVDVDQLPQLVEEVVQEYYLRHRSGQTFSAYWRERLLARTADKVTDTDYRPPVWVCEGCGHRHAGEDPPVFCPGCAGLRRYFARLEDDAAPAVVAPAAALAPRSDGFAYAAKLSALKEGEGTSVEVNGCSLALFRVGGEVRAVDALCPHEGAPLAQGEIRDGVVVCPWHSWEFNLCTGCSREPQGHKIAIYETLIEGDDIFVKTGRPAVAAAAIPAAPRQAKPVLPTTAELEVLDVLHEAPDVRTFRLDNSAGQLPLDLPGKFLKVAVPIQGETVWRSFTISSSPSEPKVVDLTIKLNPAGEVSRYLFEQMRAGGRLTVKGPQGGFCFDPARHTEPLVLLSAGSGITPMMSIARYLKATDSDIPCTFLHGARTAEDILFHEECRELARMRGDRFRYVITLSQPDDNWAGGRGRLSFDLIREHATDLTGSRYFLCGPNEFMDRLREAPPCADIPLTRIHTEQFHKTALAVVR